MANSDNAFGLRPFMKEDGSCWSGAANTYYIPASDGTAAYVGGLVKLAGSADANGVPSVTANVSAGDVVAGVIVGFDADTQADSVYRQASTERYVFVCDDPSVLFEVQEDSDASTLAADDVGNNADLVNFTSGSTSSGRSSIEIDSSSVNTTATLDVQIRRLSRRPDNVIGDYAKWLVKLNNHQFVDGTTGI